MVRIFPAYRENYIKNIIFTLSYNVEGSGLSWGLEEIQRMPLKDALYYVNRLTNQWRKENEARKRAARKK